LLCFLDDKKKIGIFAGFPGAATRDEKKGKQPQKTEN